MKKIIFAGILAGAVLIGGCGGAKEPEKTESLTQEQQDSIAEAMTSKVDEMVESLAGQADVELPEITIGGIDITDPAGGAIGELDSMESAMLGNYTGEVDLVGSWQDEVSERAGMDVTENEDGTYSILVSWSSSFDETACWEITGSWDENLGGLTYDDGSYYIVKNGEKTGEETTNGGFYKEGEKLRWKDSKNEEDAVFVKGK